MLSMKKTSALSLVALITMAACRPNIPGWYTPFVQDDGASPDAAMDGGADDAAEPDAAIEDTGVPPATIQHVAIGTGHICASSNGGSLFCWGDNSQRQAVPRTMAGVDPPIEITTPTVIPGVREVAAIGAGNDHTCVASGNSRVISCWGNNSSGQLGSASANTAEIYDTGVAGYPSDHAIALGAAFSCAASDDKSVRCWGSNGTSQCGSSTPSPTNPLVLNAGTPWTTQSISAGSNFACAIATNPAITTEKRVMCWGSNSNAQCGAPSSTLVFSTPSTTQGLATIPSAVDFLDVAAGSTHTCLLVQSATNDRQVWCLGSNVRGQLGLNPSMGEPNRETAVLVPLSGQVQQIAAGNKHTCALVDNMGAMEVHCWGDNGNAQSGPGSSGEVAPPSTEIPLALDSGDSVMLLAAGGDNSCVVTSNGRLLCWGSNQHHQLRGTDTNNSSTPVAIEINEP